MNVAGGRQPTGRGAARVWAGRGSRAALIASFPVPSSLMVALSPVRLCLLPSLSCLCAAAGCPLVRVCRGRASVGRGRYCRSVHPRPPAPSRRPPAPSRRPPAPSRPWLAPLSTRTRKKDSSRTEKTRRQIRQKKNIYFEPSRRGPLLLHAVILVQAASEYRQHKEQRELK